MYNIFGFNITQFFCVCLFFVCAYLKFAWSFNQTSSLELEVWLKLQANFGQTSGKHLKFGPKLQTNFRWVPEVSIQTSGNTWSLSRNFRCTWSFDSNFKQHLKFGLKLQVHTWSLLEVWGQTSSINLKFAWSFNQTSSSQLEVWLKLQANFKQTSSWTKCTLAKFTKIFTFFDPKMSPNKKNLHPNHS